MSDLQKGTRVMRLFFMMSAVLMLSACGVPFVPFI